MTYQTLTPADIDQFIEQGYVLLKQAYPRENALAAQDFLWDRVIETYPEYHLDKHDSSTWATVLAEEATRTSPLIHLRSFYNDPVFKACETPRLAGAIEDLVGTGRWALKDQPHNWGWWPVNFAVGAAEPWNVPAGGWHWDGMGRDHFVTSPEQGLLVLPCFSDVAAHGGGTLLATGSHKIVARYLSQFPEGRDSRSAISECAAAHPWLAALTGRAPSPADRVSAFMETTLDNHGTSLRVIETIAEAGDVLLAHPFLFHAASPNHSGKPRFMCNRAAPLTAPMKLSRPDDAYSPVEQSIRIAIA